MKWIKIILLLLVLSVTPVVAQDMAGGDAGCPTVVDDILMQVNEICADTGRNQACYGHLAMEVIARDGVGDFQFARVGDIENVENIETLRLSPMNLKNNAWGVALMRLQANIPDTLPGQNVTFVLFGDVELTNAVFAESSTARPMQAFYLTTGIGDTDCASVPESGMMVQTPKGVGEVAFSVNGVDISLGSTVYFQAQAGGEMTVRTLEGMATMVYEETLYPILCGTQLSVPLGEDLMPADLPGLLESLDAEAIKALPMVLLDAARDYALPATEEELQSLLSRLEEGGPLCGEAPFPSCEEAPWLENWQMPEFRWGENGFGDGAWQDLWANKDWDAVFDELRADLLENFNPDDYTGPELAALLDTLDEEEFATFMERYGDQLSGTLRDALKDLDFDFEFNFDGLDALDNLGNFGRRGDDDASDDDD